MSRPEPKKKPLPLTKSTVTHNEPLRIQDCLEHRFCHLSDGEKGGVGKSYFARVLVELYLHHKVPIGLADMDLHNQDVKKFYPTQVHHYKASLSEVGGRQHHADLLLQGALGQSIVGNLPANTTDALNNFLITDEQYQVAKDEGIRIICWFVSNASFESLKLFQHSLETRGHHIQFIFVRNHYFCSSNEWQFLDEYEDFQAALRKYRVPVVNLPKLDFWIRNVLDEYAVPFHVAAHGWREAELAHWDSSKAQRVKLFLRESFQEIERGLLACVR